MKLTQEQLLAAKKAESAEQLQALLQTFSVEVSAQEAAKLFAAMRKTAELSDEELDNVAGGVYCSGDCFPDRECPVCRGRGMQEKFDGDLWYLVCDHCSTAFREKADGTLTSYDVTF